MTTAALMRIMPACDGSTWRPGTGICGACGGEIKRKRAKWCCTVDCTQRWLENHFWSYARIAARLRDGESCVKCGATGYAARLEVNHKTPLRSQGYATSCSHHQDNLETLCHDCHVGETRKQHAERREEGAAARRERVGLIDTPRLL